MSAFFFLDMTKDTLAAAINFLAHTDALIIDLRNCGGGDVAMSELFVAYFFDGAENPNITGVRYTGKDVYILTSKDDYSAPEGVARELQSKKRATIVGETTRGATNITAGFPINRFFSVSVPYSRKTDVAGADISRQGVKPDIEVSADKALETAHLTALRKLLGNTVDSEMADERNKSIEALQKRLNAAKSN
jgi:C-terminal processing protease CtpA/Prc